MERERVDTVVRGFKRLKDLDPGEICSNTEGGTDERWGEWLSVAEELVRIFMGEKKLFISDRVSRFTYESLYDGLYPLLELSIKSSLV
jgi:hypothetical protein